MKEIDIKDFGKIKIKKLNVRDWEILRNECLTINPITRQEEYKTGTLVKVYTILGIVSGVFSEDYPEGMIITDRLYKQREVEYYKLNINRLIMDKIFAEIKEYNSTDDKEIGDLKKKSEQ